MPEANPLLFTPITIRGVTARNRVVISPMCQYSADDGVANEWHHVHTPISPWAAPVSCSPRRLGSPDGRITHGDLGLWTDTQPGAQADRRLINVTARCRHPDRPRRPQGQHAAAVVRKRPLRGRRQPRRASWQPWGRRRGLEPRLAGPRRSTSQTCPHLPGFRPRRVRALAAGFEIIEVHAAHGYLMHEFLSPLSNLRTDAYGGEQGPHALLLEIAAAMRARWPPRSRCSCASRRKTASEGWLELDDSVVLARELKARGVDVIDCSSGGFAGAPVWRLIDQAGNMPPRRRKRCQRACPASRFHWRRGSNARPAY